MNKKEALTFKVLCLIKRCREKGKFSLALKVMDKYKIKQVSESFYD